MTLLKRDDLEEPNHCRPISYTPRLSKVIETIMRNQINDYLNVYRFFSRHQYGFKKKRFTIDAFMHATEFIRKEQMKKICTSSVP